MVFSLAYPKVCIVIFLINIFYIIGQIIKYKLIDFRIGLLAFTSLYYFGSYINYFYYKKVHFSSGEIADIMLDPQINIIALFFVVLFQLGVMLHFETVKLGISSFYKKKSFNYVITPFMSKDNYLLLKYGIPIVGIIFLAELSILDWARISQEYTLEAISRVFFFFYVLFALLALKYSYTKYYLKQSPKFIYIIILLLLPILNYMGVRQIIFWGVLNIFICSYTFLYITENNKFSFIGTISRLTKYFTISFLFLMAISIGFLFRHQKTEIFSVLSSMTLMDVINAVRSGFIAETTFTAFNLLAVVDQASHGNSMFPLMNIFDFFVLFIPTWLFPEKYNYVHYFNFAKEFNVTPFGSWYIVGEFVASLYYPVLVFMGAFLYVNLIYYFVKYLLKKSKTILSFCLYYSITYVFASLFTVRSPVESGLKVGVTIFIAILLLKYFLKLSNIILSKSTRLHTIE